MAAQAKVTVTVTTVTVTVTTVITITTVNMAAQAKVTRQASHLGTATATDPPSAKSPTMHSRLVHQDRNQKSPGLLVPVAKGHMRTNQRILRVID